MLKEDVRPSDTQIRALEWMLNNEKLYKCGIIGLKPGSGKTMTLLSLTCQSASPKRKNLYIVPPALLQQWKSETEKFTHLKCALYVKHNEKVLQELLCGDSHIIFMSYYSLLYAEPTSIIFSYPWERIVADEAHQVKNPECKISLKTHLLKSDFRWAITGTPMIDNPGDLYGICKFLRSEGCKNKTNFESSLRRKNLLKKLLLQSTTDDVAKLNLKELITHDEMVKMNESETLHYKTMFQKVRKEAIKQMRHPQSKGENKKSSKMLELVMKLRMASADLTAIWPSEGLPSMSAKFRHVLSLIYKIRQSHPDEKILLFSNFTAIINKYKSYLRDMKIRSLTFTGDIPRKERDVLFDAFTSDKVNKYPVLLVGYKCGNAGLNLQCATHVILNEPYWNPSVEEQAIARAHRKGQEKTVHAYKVITADTIEEKIKKISDRKGKDINKLLQKASGGNARSVGLNMHELQSMLSISE